MSATVDIRRADTRPHTRIDWLDSRHSFSFGRHDDPANTHHGLLLVCNDDRVRAGTGFSTHPHQDMEIITWVLSGRLEHKDSEGNRGELYPGLAQRMSAGTGIWHSEMNPSGGLQPVASGKGHDSAISIRQRDAVLWAGRLKPGERVAVPDGRRVHLFVAAGDVVLEGAGPLAEGDAARLEGADPGLTGGAGGAEVLIWVTD
ncbi:MAG: pirin family protein [Acidimicrobiales bacterium]